MGAAAAAAFDEGVNNRAAFTRVGFADKQPVLLAERGGEKITCRLSLEALHPQVGLRDSDTGAVLLAFVALLAGRYLVIDNAIILARFFELCDP